METICHCELPFEEDRLWSQSIRPWLLARGIGGEALKIANYVTTEMLNNVRDHSESPTVTVEGSVEPDSLSLAVIDVGIGAFRRLALGLGLASPAEAVIEVAKGKRTTDPSHHTGQGIYFASLICDTFRLEANRFAVCFEYGQPFAELKFLAGEARVGTTVRFRIARDPTRSLRGVFDVYCPQPDLEFSRTRVSVNLMAQADGSLVSRSQARRLMAGLERFSEVELDFAGVNEIGQGFADEAFRVWHNAHPAVDLRVVHTAEGVEYMLRHVGFRRAAN